MPQHISLTKGFFAVVDNDDYHSLNQFSWFYTNSGYARCAYSQNGKLRYLYMHRVIMAARRGQLVDHIDGDRLNNTRANLRIVTANENNWNRARNQNSSSPYKGVTLDSRGWQARIRYYTQSIHLGYFTDGALAAQVYDTAAQLFFGEYARLNNPAQGLNPELVLLVYQRIAHLHSKSIGQDYALFSALREAVLEAMQSKGSTNHESTPTTAGAEGSEADPDSTFEGVYAPELDGEAGLS
jgi:hypothetical protein